MGELNPIHVTAGGTRYYSQEQANMIFGKKVKANKRITIGYYRVSSNKARKLIKELLESDTGEKG